MAVKAKTIETVMLGDRPASVKQRELAELAQAMAENILLQYGAHFDDSSPRIFALVVVDPDVGVAQLCHSAQKLDELRIYGLAIKHAAKAHEMSREMRIDYARWIASGLGVEDAFARTDN